MTINTAPNMRALIGALQKYEPAAEGKHATHLGHDYTLYNRNEMSSFYFFILKLFGFILSKNDVVDSIERTLSQKEVVKLTKSELKNLGKMNAALESILTSTETTPGRSEVVRTTFSSRIGKNPLEISRSEGRARRGNTLVMPLSDKEKHAMATGELPRKRGKTRRPTSR